jgi:hypothetical protein
MRSLHETIRYLNLWTTLGLIVASQLAAARIALPAVWGFRRTEDGP